MRVLCATEGIVNNKNPKQGISDIRKAEYDYVYFSFAQFCSSYALENMGNPFLENKYPETIEIAKHPETLKDYVSRAWMQCEKEGMSVTVAIAPYLQWDAKCTDKNSLLKTLAQESIKICGSMSCEYLVVRPLQIGIADDEIWKVNREFYLSLVPLARENHVRILLENQCKNVNGHFVRGICADSGQAASWIEELNKEAGEGLFGFCLDVGVCNLCGQDMYEYICDMGDYINVVLIRDGAGSEDVSHMPFVCGIKGQSKTDWLSVIRGLREIQFDGELVLCASDTLMSFSPLLRPQAISLGKSVAEYFRWQIEIEGLLKKYENRVLFGAGNMCRNYMKCYGEEFPPLFTCDNNPQLWGKEFCGLQVKEPENLREIPQDCAIFICNIYYREIEEQLRQMGIKNPIEYFNDEYMPSFYYDRI